MAAEEDNKLPSLPQYPEMIFAAIAALKEENGSSKSAISKYIESQHGELPEGHSTLLSHHLNRMKDSGELVMVKNNYMRPNPNNPPKRGRGRPPKPKEPLPPGVVVSPPRPRGRPPKPKDESGAPKVPLEGAPKPKEPSTKVGLEGSGKRRGRPPKKAKPGGVNVTTVTSTGPPRPRGRPPKMNAPFASVGFD